MGLNNPDKNHGFDELLFGLFACIKSFSITLVILFRSEDHESGLRLTSELVLACSVILELIFECK